MTLDEILRAPMTRRNDAGANTLGEYLKLLLYTLWVEGEGFSGKRPFGNSGWDYEIYTQLVDLGVVFGKLDEYGDLVDFNKHDANQLTIDLITHIFKNYYSVEE